MIIDLSEKIMKEPTTKELLKQLTIEMKNGFATVNARLDNLEKDVAVLKSEAKVHRWNV